MISGDPGYLRPKGFSVQWLRIRRRPRSSIRGSRKSLRNVRSVRSTYSHVASLQCASAANLPRCGNLRRGQRIASVSTSKAVTVKFAPKKGHWEARCKGQLGDS